LVDKKK